MMMPYGFVDAGGVAMARITMLKEARVADQPGDYLGVLQAPTESLVERVRAGFPFPELEALRDRLGMSIQEAASLAGIPGRTLARRRQAGRLGPTESERVLRIERLFALATQMLRDAGYRQRHDSKELVLVDDEGGGWGRARPDADRRQRGPAVVVGLLAGVDGVVRLVGLGGEQAAGVLEAAPRAGARGRLLAGPAAVTGARASEAAFELRVEEARRGAVRVTLVRPDGTTQDARGRVCVEMFSPPRLPSSVLMLDGLPREAAPAGTIVYRLDDPAVA